MSGQVGVSVMNGIKMNAIKLRKVASNITTKYMPTGVYPRTKKIKRNPHSETTKKKISDVRKRQWKEGIYDNNL